MTEYTPSRDMLQHTDTDEQAVTVRFGPVGSFAAMRSLASRIGRLFAHIIRLNVRTLYPWQLRELIKEFMQAFLGGLRREPEIARLQFLDVEYPEVDLEQAAPMGEIEQVD
jgi:hypothetical protein